MPRTDEKLEKATIRLFAGDAKRLADYYPNVGYNVAIRKIVRNHLRALDERASELRSKVDVKEL